ncbi:hypothetical protein FRACYDRAFT_240121 [Fragilariopsis cylindrus CCMP1102]|uniref:Uncharacterized protein n=1 Tax=Fragilariopsis cylindrus CCMP1102 TaxID=635003 RepID=A0A1E7FC95_9STRA|nr:hypothetical protein FRACYDRAFT_240121 [Fragilariopsis cylindrus CCMP1102]|eukprot:OEU15433.1 hypothetical protein FRACYDRAFT_240121 [Fragilariopsis cylindrus CCMP1102]
MITAKECGVKSATMDSSNKKSSRNNKSRSRTSFPRRSNEKKKSAVDDDITMMECKISSENTAAAAAAAKGGGGIPAEVSFDSNTPVVDVNKNYDDKDSDRNKFLVPAATAATTATSSAKVGKVPYPSFPWEYPNHNIDRARSSSDHVV